MRYGEYGLHQLEQQARLGRPMTTDEEREQRDDWGAIGVAAFRAGIAEAVRRPQKYHAADYWSAADEENLRRRLRQSGYWPESVPYEDPREDSREGLYEDGYGLIRPDIGLVGYSW